MHLSKIIFVTIFFFTFSYASSEFISIKNLKEIEHKVSLLNEEIVKQKIFIEQQESAFDDIHQIKMMVYEAGVLKNKMLQKYENRQCLSLSYAIESIQKRLSALKAKKHPAFEDEIKQQERLLKFTQDSFDKCSHGQ